MKAFEKWHNREIRPYIHNPDDKQMTKAGWKAALEWVLSEIHEHQEPMDVIEEELRK